MSARNAVLGVLPARLLSTRLTQKLLRDLRGRPIIQHTFEAAKKCPLLSRVVVATDSDEIRRKIEDIGGEVVMTSPDIQSGTDRVMDCARRLGFNGSIVVNIQADEPAVDPKNIEAAIRTLRSDRKAVMGTVVTRLTSPEEWIDRNVVKCVTSTSQDKQRALYFSRAPLPHSKSGLFDASFQHYWRHIGIYAYRTKFMLNELAKLPFSHLQQSEDLEQLKVLEAGHTIAVGQVESSMHGVDTLKQLENLERWMAAQEKKQ